MRLFLYRNLLVVIMTISNIPFSVLAEDGADGGTVIETADESQDTSEVRAIDPSL